jgi:hypothetical protein
MNIKFAGAFIISSQGYRQMPPHLSHGSVRGAATSMVCTQISGGRLKEDVAQARWMMKNKIPFVYLPEPAPTNGAYWDMHQKLHGETIEKHRLGELLA